MQITEIAFTGYSVADMKRSRAFYEDILGLKKSRDWEQDKWVEYDIGSGCLALITGGGDQWRPDHWESPPRSKSMISTPT